MHDSELHRFKTDIDLVQYAIDRYGYQRDRRESSRACHVLRHAVTNDKIIVRKASDGHWTYFSVRDDRDHGTIVDFVQARAPPWLARSRPRGATPLARHQLARSSITACRSRRLAVR